MNALDKKSIDSFLRVAGGLSKSSSDTNAATTAGSNPVDSAKVASRIERAVKEGENLRLILRSNGHEFPANDNITADENNPEYVVCLAHHAPSDQFILFAFNSTTMPCRLIRYDRDGKVIQNDAIKNKLSWSEIDAAALVAAVNKCHEGNAAYFDRAACTASDAKGRGECLRLVHMNHGLKGSDEEMSDSEEEDEDIEDEDEEEEEEYEAIRSVILKELLGNGPKGANFHHPDPSFLLPLSRSISKELKRWRYMCNHAPSRSEWPKLPSTSEWDAANVDNDDDAMSGVEKVEFDKIVSKRNSQFRKSVKYCQDAMEKMKSLLCKIAERGDDSASIYELGKEGIVSLTTIEFMNQQHAESWPDYHDVFEEIDQTCYEASDEIKNYLMTWDRDSEGISEESDEEEISEEDVTYTEVATKLVNAWIKEDKALLKALSNAVTTIDQSLRSEQQSLQSAIDSIKSELDSISSLKKEAERTTRLKAVRFVKLWNNSCPEDAEEEPGVRLAPLMPQWTGLSLEQHLSFGWWASEHEESSVMNFVIDTAGLTAYLKRCISDVTDFSTSRSQKKFDSVWAKKMQPAINSTLESIKTFLELGDLRNASIVSACCLGVFCDGAIIGAVGHWYEHNDDYRENETSDNVTSKFQKLWRMYDPYVAEIALAYFDIESPKREAGSHWFFDALQSGLVYAPCDSSDIHWSEEDFRATEYEVWWDRLSHPACEIFFHHGWQHQIFLRLRSCNKKEELSLLGLTNYEAPIVIKARFNIMKELGRTRDAIAFARIMRGDHECIHYLFDNGLVDEAMVQASASKNVEGLSQLSKDLVSTNPCASVLCIQAHILGVMEGLDTQNNYRGFPEKGIDHLIGILQENWLRPSDVGELPDHCVSYGAPSLRLLTTISLARAFLCAAKSTAEVQAIFEQKYFAECGISPLLATITIATRARMAGGKSSSSDMSLKHLLRKMGLLSMEITDVSGFLTQMQPVVKNLGGMDYLDLVCFLYESAKFLIEEGCRSVFCFTLLLYSSVQIGVRTGCESFALDVIGSLKEVKEDRFEFGFYTSTSPLSSLSACFSALFSNCGYDACQDIQIALLETFLQVKVEHSNSSYHSNIFNRDVHQSRVWMGMAYSHRHGRKAAIDAIVSNIISNQLGDSDTDEVILQTLRSLAEVDVASGGNHTMKSYVNSAKREQFIEKERDEITKGFISRVLETAPFLAATTIADLIRQYREIDPLFLVCDSTDLETKLSSASEFKLAVSKRASLFVTCTIMHYVHDNTYTVLELGLSWLRNALYSGGFIQFDNSEKRGWSQSRYEEERDYQMFLSADAWSNSYLYRNAHKILEGRPKLAAKALVAVLEAKALLALEQTPRISHLCREALVLCRILEFLLEPTLNGIAAVEDAWRNSQLREDQLPLVLQPSKLVSFIMDPDWSLRPDYLAKPDVLEEDYVSSTAFLDDRVAIAVSYGHITGAASLCAKALNNEFWTKLSDRSRRWSISYNCGKNIRRVLRACLHVINGAITSREDLPEDYVNHALHMVLSMNWFRACSKCSPNSSSVNMHAQELVVCIDSVALVHDIALAWSDLLDETKSPFGQSLSHCLNVLRCLSRCIHILEEGKLLSSQCDECYLRHDITHPENDDDSENEDDVTDEQIHPRKKRKLLESSTAGSDFKELEGYAVQLHMKEQCDWCIDATRRIEKSRRISDCMDAIHRIKDNDIICV